MSNEPTNDEPKSLNGSTATLDEDNDLPCPQGFVKNEKGECVPINNNE